MEWLESQFLYLGLMLFSMSYPLAQSFERRLKYYKNWRGLFIGICIMMLVFIPWDIWFTDIGVWWFNDDYITGVKLWLLPLEEWLFFIIVPFACIFIHEVLKHFISKDLLIKTANPFFITLIPILLAVGLMNLDRLYTALTFISTALALVYLVYRKPVWRGRFLMTYLVCWLPFLLINGALTGNFTQDAVVNYNPEEFLGYRVTTIPIEDSVYNLLMLLMVVWVYEWQRKENV